MWIIYSLNLGFEGGTVGLFSLFGCKDCVRLLFEDSVTTQLFPETSGWIRIFGRIKPWTRAVRAVVYLNICPVSWVPSRRVSWLGIKSPFCWLAKEVGKSVCFCPLGFLGLPWWSSGWLPIHSAERLDYIPCQGTRSHRLQLRVHMLWPKKKKKILHTATKTQCSQINNFLKEFENL